jgi:hypothetical protein
MPATLQRLLRSMRRSLWHHAQVYPERLRHVVDERGQHHIAIVLTGDEVEAAGMALRPVASGHPPRLR